MSQHRDDVRSWLLLCLVGLVAGVGAGIVGTAFRVSLVYAAQFRMWLDEVTRGYEWIGWLVPVAAACLAVVIARALVIAVPAAGGSGVQRIEAAVRSQIQPDGLAVIPVKFVGGVLAIGSGLALGREGPTVQMSAILGSRLARALRMDESGVNDAQAALAGAGLGVAFNAPLGGAIFVMEELTKSVRLRLVVVTLMATTSAITVMRFLTGSAVDFTLGHMSEITVGTLVGCAVFGGLIGLLGVWYNKSVLWFADMFAKFDRVPILVRAGAVGALVGLVGWFFPAIVGGGDNLTQQLLSGSTAAGLAVLILVARWILGPLSYSIGAPGGLFAPLLVLGAATGVVFAAGIGSIPGFTHDPVGYAFVGMAAFFAAVVRAPLTGIVLVVEMTGVTSALIPMMLATGVAVVVTTVMRSEPIYDTLRHRLLRGSH